MTVRPRSHTVPAVPAQSMGRPWLLIAILVLFSAVAGLYNLNTPIYEAPDELQHAAYVAWLADGHGLPQVSVADPGPWQQEGTQPPLYYWLVARSAGWLAGPADRLAKLNPYAGIGDPQRPDNKNRVLHEQPEAGELVEEGAPFVHLARAISTIMALGTLLGIYLLGRIVFPERPGFVAAMVGLVAFIPQYLFLSASINNDNLVILISVWTLVILARWLSGARLPGWAGVAGLGILLGLGALAKFSGLLLWPLALGVMAWLAWGQRQWRWLLRAVLLALGLALLISGWWFAHNLQLYDDISALGPHLEIMGTRRRLPSWPAAVREFAGFRYSFWALFGWFNILAPEPFYWIMDALVIAGVVGLVLFLARSFRRLAAAARHTLIMLVAWLALVGAGVLRWTLLTPASQGRLLYPALPALALLLVAGWTELVPSRLQLPVGALSLAGWVGWAVLCSVLVIKPAYALPPRMQSLEELAFEPSELRVRYDNFCELVGYQRADQDVLPSQRVPLTLVWRSLQPADQDYSLFVHAVTPDGEVVGQLDTYHGGGMYPTSQWRQGEILVDTVYVPISRRAEGPALLQFNVGLHVGLGPERLPAFGPDGEPLDIVYAGEAALVPPSWPTPGPAPAVEAVFEDKIRLAGLDLPQQAVQPGDLVTVTLQWQALADMDEDFVGFVHLVSPSGQDLAQDDHLPLAGRYPTRLWSEDTVVSDPYRLALPEGLAPGEYELLVGFYRPGLEARLRAVSPGTGERWKDDLVQIGTLEIGRAAQN
ncbi:MAG: glycosyltransferase family 39 protein [Anaerolineae bacterium]